MPIGDPWDGLSIDGFFIIFPMLHVSDKLFCLQITAISIQITKNALTDNTLFSDEVTLSLSSSSREK